MQSRMPIYEQLKARIIELVMLDAIKPNEQLPSVRSLARDLGVNPNTVQKAYQELERDGFIYSVSGKGSFIMEHIEQNSAIQKKCLEQLEQSMNDAKLYGVSYETVSRMAEAVFKGETE